MTGCPVHVDTWGGAWEKQCPGLAAVEYVVFVVPSLTGLLRFSTLLHNSGGTAKQLISSKPAAQARSLCLGFRTVQTKGETTSYGQSTAAQHKRVVLPSLAVVLPSPLVCFALSGGHHMVFHILPTITFVSVLVERRHAITGESVNMGVLENSQ